MLRLSGGSSRALAVRRFVPLLAIGCAAIAWSHSAAAAPVTVAQLLADPRNCWAHQDFDQGEWSELGEPKPASIFYRTGDLMADFSDPGATYLVGKRQHARLGFSMERWMRVPCPPPEGRYFTGLNGGFSLNETVGILTWIESLNGVTTNQNSARRDPFGAGINIGYGFRPWNNNLVVNPFLSFDYQGWSVNYVFPNGSFIGTKSNYEGTAGVKIGPTFPAGVWLYAIGGVSFLNETLTVNFIPVSSSTTKTVPVATLGLGGAIQPSWLQVFGVPTSLSLEWQHTWWQTANFNNPASSPAFSYAYKREDDKIKLGINFYLSR
jgi:hypothetical protein